MFRLENLRSDIRRLHIQVDITDLMLLFGFLFKLVESIDPVLRFCPTRLRLTAHPVELLAKQVTGPVHLGIQRVHSFLSFFQIIAVIPFILINLFPVYLDNLTTDTIQKITVVRHHQNTNVRARKISFQPFGHFQVQVVGWLVKDDQFGIGDQHVCQSHPFQLPAGKRFHLLVEVMDFQLSQNLFGTLFIIPGFQVIHPKQDIFEIGMIAACHRLLIFGDQTHRLVRRVETRLQNSQAVRIMRHLFQVANPQIISEHNRPAVIILLSGYNI